LTSSLDGFSYQEATGGEIIPSSLPSPELWRQETPPSPERTGRKRSFDELTFEDLSSSFEDFLKTPILRASTDSAGFHSEDGEDSSIPMDIDPPVNPSASSDSGGQNFEDLDPGNGNDAPRGNNDFQKDPDPAESTPSAEDVRSLLEQEENIPTPSPSPAAVVTTGPPDQASAQQHCGQGSYQVTQVTQIILPYKVLHFEIEDENGDRERYFKERDLKSCELSFDVRQRVKVKGKDGEHKGILEGLKEKGIVALHARQIHLIPASAIHLMSQN